MVYIVSTTVFSSLILLMVVVLLFVESKVVQKGNYTIIINDDEEKTIETPFGKTLLSSLSGNGIFIPSACGGGGSCGMCKCRVESGAVGHLPTELVHLNRTEKKENVHLACQFKVKDNIAIRIPDELFDVKKFNATVVSNDNVATFIKELVLQTDSGEELDFTAGAYIQIDIPEYELAFNEFRVRVAERYRPDWDRFSLWGLASRTEEPIFRAYSLASSPAEKSVLRFTIRIATPPPGTDTIPPGQGSSFIFNLKPGDRITFSGPYGDFFVKDTDREICFIGGGAGMAPLRSQITYLLDTEHTKRKMSFWYGARSKLELFFADEFERLERENDNFSFHVALSNPCPEDNWSGMTGYIHEQLRDGYLASHEDPTEIEYYLCGPPMMIDAVVSMLDDLGVEEEMIAYDKF